MRLRDPKKGTVVRLGDADQIAGYQARGWVEVGSTATAPEVEESPAPKRRGRPPKTN